MQYIYFGTLFAATLTYLLIGLLLFLQRKKGERSRKILAGMMFLSVLNYIGVITSFLKDPLCNTDSIMQVPFLLIGIFVVTIYVIYPIEVISPGWLTWKRLSKIYMPIIGLFLFYRLTLWLGVEYTSYLTMKEMVKDIWTFQVIFRMVLVLLIFLPVVLLYYIPYTRRYNNTDHKWTQGYIAAVMINMAAYLYVNTNDTFLVCSLYVVISIACSLYIAYQELYVRLINCSDDIPLSEDAFEELSPANPELTIAAEADVANADSNRAPLFYKLEEYMNTTKAWRNPDLMVADLTKELYTNRNFLREAIQQQGYINYNSYINTKRIEDFIRITQQQKDTNYTQTFFNVGFRSKTTALRNFKEITGAIPTEYFKVCDERK